MNRRAFIKSAAAIAVAPACLAKIPVATPHWTETPSTMPVFDVSKHIIKTGNGKLANIAPFVLFDIIGNDPWFHKSAVVWMEYAWSIEDAKKQAQILKKPSEFQTLSSYDKLPSISWFSPDCLREIVTRIAVHDDVPIEKATMLIQHVPDVPGVFFGLIESSRIATSTPADAETVLWKYPATPSASRDDVAGSVAVGRIH